MLLSVSLLFGFGVCSDAVSWEHPQRIQKIKTDDAQILYAKTNDLCSKKKNDKACQELLDYLEDVYYSSSLNYVPQQQVYAPQYVQTQAVPVAFSNQSLKNLPEKKKKKKKKAKVVAAKEGEKSKKSDEWKSVIPKEQDKKFSKITYRLNEKSAQDMRAELDKYRGQESGSV